MPRYIDSEIKNRIHEQMRTPANNAQPEAEVVIARARYSVTDTSQFQVDDIRDGNNLGDLGVDLKRPDINQPPTYIYEVHHDDGYIKTSTRQMPAITSNEWVDGVTIAAGTLCRLAFNGDWIWNERQQKYRFQTSGDPFLFYTDDSDNLQWQIWESATGREQLATGVTVSMDCIRGWREPNTTANDQGFIVAYIKTDGKLYYRQYRYNVSDYAWESEQEATISGVSDAFTNITLFRTPDYRLGFAITTELDEVYWLITDRNWAGLALRPTALDLNVTDYDITRTKITFVEGFTAEAMELALTGYTLTKLNGIPVAMDSATNIDDGTGDYGNTVEITYDGPIYGYTGLASRFSIRDATDSLFICFTVGLKSGTDNVLELTFDDFNAASGDLTVHYSAPASGGIENEAGELSGNDSTTWTPTGLVDPGNPAPEVDTIENVEGDEL